MKKIYKIAPLGVVVLALGACGTQCPRTADYNRPPYTYEGTAGEGIAVYDGACETRATEDTTYRQTTTTSTPVVQGDDTFKESVKK